MTGIFLISREVVENSASDIVPNQAHTQCGLTAISNLLPTDVLTLSPATRKKIVAHLRIRSEAQPFSLGDHIAKRLELYLDTDGKGFGVEE